MKNKITPSLTWILYFISATCALATMPALSVENQAIIFFIFVAASAKASEKGGILHPISWFGIFFFLYSTSYPLLYSTQGGTSENIKSVIPLSFSAYIIFCLSVLLTAPSTRPSLPPSIFSKRFLSFLLWPCLAVCTTLAFIAATSGASSKRDFLNYAEEKNISSLFIFFIISALIYALALLEKFKDPSKTAFPKILLDKQGIAILSIFLIAFGATGERDYIFRLLLLIMLIAFSTRYKYKYYYLIASSIALVLILPLTQAAKSYLLADQIIYEGYQAGDIFNTEFASAGKNIFYVIDRNITGYNGETLIYDLKRYFDFIFSDQQSTVSWFNNYIRGIFREDGTAGWGFSLVAEGYINFGYIGPALIFLIIGLATGIVYRLSQKNSAYFGFYILYIPSLIYVIRADIGNYLSIIFKVNLIIILLVFISGKIWHALQKKETTRQKFQTKHLPQNQ